MSLVGHTQGKRAGTRRGAKPPRTFRPALLALAGGVTLAVIAWGYLVFAAIDFGSSARGGDNRAWWFLGLAALGAVACLFIGLMLVVRLLRGLGITSAPSAHTPDSAPSQVAPPPPGGRRAAR